MAGSVCSGSPSAARADGRVRRSTMISARSSMTAAGLGTCSPPRSRSELWLTDITEHKTAEGKLYLCAIKDVFSGRIVGYFDRLADEVETGRPEPSRMPPRCAATSPATWCIAMKAIIRSRKFLRALTRHRMIGSMGRVGSSRDNAAMESFFALLQKNVLDHRSWNTREQLRIAIVTWIERTYHRRRRQPRLGRLTPSSSRPS